MSHQTDTYDHTYEPHTAALLLVGSDATIIITIESGTIDINFGESQATIGEDGDLQTLENVADWIDENIPGMTANVTGDFSPETSSDVLVEQTVVWPEQSVIAGSNAETNVYSETFVVGPLEPDDIVLAGEVQVIPAMSGVVATFPAYSASAEVRNEP